MNKLLITALIILLSACSDSDRASDDRSSSPENENPSPQPQSAATPNHIQAYSLSDGRDMADAFREEVGTSEMENIQFPKSLIIEKTHVLRLLQELDTAGGSGGLILYPVLEPGTGSFSLAVTVASFATDADGNYSSGDVSVIYPVIDGTPSVFESLVTCPNICGTIATDLYNQ